MSKDQFCQLAHVINAKHSIAGQFVSEKLDGMRALWDGGVSRGIPKVQVPYANKDRDERYVTPPVATGLWSRYGNVIHAPDWFLDYLPPIPLDMELYAGRKRFQFVMKTVKDLRPGTDWLNIQGIVLDTMPIEEWLRPRTINERNCKIVIGKNALPWWWEQRMSRSLGVAHMVYSVAPTSTFEHRLRFIRGWWSEQCFLKIHDQIELPFNTAAAQAKISELISEITAAGGEGLVVKRRVAKYTCDRSWDVLKVKPEHDAEATVVGYVWGDLPDNTRSTTGEATGKYLGLMGSLLCEFNGKQFKLSGFTDEERQLSFVSSGECAADEGILHPGEIVDDSVHSKIFRRGSTVTFKYRELSDDGLPKEARFARRRPAE